MQPVKSAHDLELHARPDALRHHYGELVRVRVRLGLGIGLG